MEVGGTGTLLVGLLVEVGFSVVVVVVVFLVVVSSAVVGLGWGGGGASVGTVGVRPTLPLSSLMFAVVVDMDVVVKRGEQKGAYRRRRGRGGQSIQDIVVVVVLCVDGLGVM